MRVTPQLDTLHSMCTQYVPVHTIHTYSGSSTSQNMVISYGLRMAQIWAPKRYTQYVRTPHTATTAPHVRTPVPAPSSPRAHRTTGIPRPMPERRRTRCVPRRCRWGGSVDRLSSPLWAGESWSFKKAGINRNPENHDWDDMDD